jgi:hypothetical protein
LRIAAQLAQTATKVGSGFSGPLAIAEPALETLEEYVVDILAEKVVRLNPSLDLEKLAQNLEKFSDRLKVLSEQGYLAPRKKKVSSVDLAAFKDKNSSLRKAYIGQGFLFMDSYRNHLKDFSPGPLEKEAADVAKGMTVKGKGKAAT